jgi:hypothetical protein
VETVLTDLAEIEHERLTTAIEQERLEATLASEVDEEPKIIDPEIVESEEHGIS